MVNKIRNSINIYIFIIKQRPFHSEGSLYQANFSWLCLDFNKFQPIYHYRGYVHKKIRSSFDNILNNICFIFSDMIMYSSSLVTVSVARITGTIFETINNQGKNNQPGIAVASVYVASYDYVCDEDSRFQIKIKNTMMQRMKDFLPTVVTMDDIVPLHI